MVNLIYVRARNGLCQIQTNNERKIKTQQQQQIPSSNVSVCLEN